MKSKVVAKKTNHSDRVEVPVAEIKRAVERSSHVLVATHVDPDGDAIGTQLAFAAYVRDLGKRVSLVRDSDIPEKYMFLPDVRSIQTPETVGDNLDVDLAVILECPHLDRLGSVRRYLKNGITMIHIDHHRDSSMFADVNWIDTTASSVGEMVWEYFTKVGYRISPSVAEQLYTAVLTDTGRFRYDSTTRQTMCCAGDLIEAGAQPHKICDYVYYNVPPEAMKLVGKVLNSVEFYRDDRICVLSLTKQMLIETGARESDSEGLVDYTLFNRGVVAGALLKEVDEGHTRVSFRSNNHIDVAGIAARYGGGGHYNASGCTLPMNLVEARREVIRLLTEADSDHS
jgi:phosphoesterase RecJ-like protein